MHRGVGFALEEFRLLEGQGVSKGVSFVSLTGIIRSVWGLCCRGGRFGGCASGEDGATTAAVIVLDVEEGDMDGEVINTLSREEVAVLGSIERVERGV
jgi:hypothetical protein